MVKKRNQVTKLCGVHELVYGFARKTRAALVFKFGGVTFFFIGLSFVIIYFLSDS